MRCNISPHVSGGLAKVAILLCASISSAATIDAGWTADGDTNPSDGWTASIGTGHTDFSEGGPANPPTLVAIADAGAQAFTGQSNAYNFDGTDDALLGATWNGQSGTYGSEPTDRNATFDLYFSIGDYNQNHVLFETGAGTDGFGIVLQGSSLIAAVNDNADMAGTAQLATATVDLSNAIAGVDLTEGTDWFLARVAIDLASSLGTSDGLLQISVSNSANSTILDDSSTYSGIDWAGGNNSGIAVDNGGLGGDGQGQIGATYVPLDGQIAQLLYYHEEFVSPVPEPSAIALSVMALLSLGILAWRRRS